MYIRKVKETASKALIKAAFTASSMKDSYTLHLQDGVCKPVIIIDNCVVTSWFTLANLQCVFLKLSRPSNNVFRFVFCI